MNLNIPENALIVLMGASGSGKSTFARKHFFHSEILSSDHFRLLTSNSESNQEVNRDAFDILYYILEKRLQNKLLSVVDATNLQDFARKNLLKLAEKYHVESILLAFNLPNAICEKHNQSRPERIVPDWVIKKHNTEMQQALQRVTKEGFSHIHIFHSLDKINSLQLKRQKLSVNQKQESGPFDIIGDVHGCFAELNALIHKLGYQITGSDPYTIYHPQDRKLVFLGDLVDRGPDVTGTLEFVRDICADKAGFCVIGNHENKLLRKLKGEKIRISSGMDTSLNQLKYCKKLTINDVITFLSQLESHYVFDRGQLVVCHAGLNQDMHGKNSHLARDYAMYGETTGSRDEYGLPIRLNWAIHYRGQARIVYGHTPIQQPIWVNNTINIDTGCVFGGNLTALQYPELRVVSVRASKVYYPSPRPFPQSAASMLAGNPFLLSHTDIVANPFIETGKFGKIFLDEKKIWNSIHFITEKTIHPGAIFYLPLGMVNTHRIDDIVQYYRKKNISHLYYRTCPSHREAIVLLFKNRHIGKQKFGVDYYPGVLYNRFGEPFWLVKDRQRLWIEKLHQILEQQNIWHTLQTEWLGFQISISKEQKMIPEYVLIGENDVYLNNSPEWHHEFFTGFEKQFPSYFENKKWQKCTIEDIDPLAKLAEQEFKQNNRSIKIIAGTPTQPATKQIAGFYLTNSIDKNSPSPLQIIHRRQNQSCLAHESLNLLQQKQPYYRIHQCILAILGFR